MSFPEFDSSTTAEEVATAFSSEITGKNVLITGTSLNGLGFETARVIAQYANLVIITGYNTERLKLSEEALKKDVPTAHIRCQVLDLSSLTSVREAAANINATAEPIHVLIHNAAAPVVPFKLTPDNLEFQMATDHIGPFLLTKLLLPKLLAAKTTSYTPRVVILSSSAHSAGTGVNFATIAHPDPAAYDAFQTYFQAKSANALMGIELSRRSGGHVNAYSVHPGMINTNIMQKQESKAVFQAWGILQDDGTPDTKNFQWKTIPQGAATTLVAAFDPRLNDCPGAYLSDCKEANADLAAHSSSLENAARLWSATEEILGEKFAFAS